MKITNKQSRRILAFPLAIMLGGQLMAAQMTPLPRMVDFTKGDQPEAATSAYSLRWEGVMGIPNGVEEKGADARQIYISQIAKGGTLDGKLRVGDVVLGLNGKRFDGNVIDTFRTTVEDAPLYDKAGGFSMLVWRDGGEITLTFQTLVPVPDLTQPYDVGKIHDWTLGPTGARGWLFNRGLDTTDARQIRITRIDAGSPASGVLEIGDVILGVKGKPFANDVRRAFGEAIADAETEQNKGRLELLCWRKGQQIPVTVQLKVMGSYSETSPYDCPKAKRIVEEGCREIMKDGLHKGIPGNLNALALLASGNPEYLDTVKAYAREVGPPDMKVKLQEGMYAWSWGYDNLLLTEYYLATKDDYVLPAIREFTVNIAAGQGYAGTWGHGMRVAGNNGTLGGYGAVNQAGLICWMSLVLGQKCGVTDEVVRTAVANSRKFFGFYVGKGSIPYGDHPPYALLHDDNGKSASAAISFGMLGDQVPATYFSRLATAAYGEKEYGHTGNYFSFLWGALGANCAGPEAVAAYMKELRWYYDFARGWNGRTIYQGKAGEPTGGSAEHQYGGWDMTGLFVLHYALPLKKLHITGKDANPVTPLTGKELQDAIACGSGFTYAPADFTYNSMTSAQLLKGLASWSPVVRQRAARAISKKQDDLVPQLIAMLDAGDLNTRYGACLALQYLEGRAAPAVDALTGLLSAKDMWLRTRAGFALATIGKPARKAVPEMLKRIQSPDPADKRDMEPKYFSFALFRTNYGDNLPRGKGLLADSVEGIDRDLLFPSIKRLLASDDGFCGWAMCSIFKSLSTAELKSLLPDIVRIAAETQPSGEMFAQDLRVEAFKFLAANKIPEGLPAFIKYFQTQNGWGCKTTVLLPLLKQYGPAARPILPQLKELQTTWKSRKDNSWQERAKLAAEIMQSIEQEDTGARERSAANAQRPQSSLPESVKATLDIPYADTSNTAQRLDLYLPAKRADDKPLPVIVFIHGGAWQGGNKTDGRGNVLPFVSGGRYAGASVEYRLSGAAKWPAQIEDCKAAIRWLKGHANEYGLDPQKIGVWGASAGGHLVAMLGVTGNARELEGTLGKHLDQTSRVACVADYFGPTNMLTMGDFPSKMAHNDPNSPESRLIGGAVQENKDKARNASPITYVTGDDAPVFIAHGTTDPLVPYNQSETFEAALKKANVPAYLQTIENGNHGGFEGPELKRRLTAFFDKYLHGADTTIDTGKLKVRE